ncbi:MAG: hypothetical protein ACREXK_13625 [Gammaproteobacteria bacterium]
MSYNPTFVTVSVAFRLARSTADVWPPTLAGLRGFLPQVAKVLAAIAETLSWVGAMLVVFLIVYFRRR